MDKPLIPLDETLNEVKAEVWNAIHQLPHLRNEIHNEDRNTLINVDASAAGIAKIRLQAIPSHPRAVEEVVKEAQEIWAVRSRINHPRFLTAIPGAALPVSWLGDLFTSAFNAYSGVWLGAPGVAAIEVELIAWLASQVGLPKEAGGLFVSGGSMANLTAMVVARDRRLKDHERGKGVAYFSDQSHFAVTKGLSIIGLVPSQMRMIPSDSMHRMDMIELEKAVIADKAKGLVPFLTVANCGTTNTGAIDPLNKIADLACDHGMWMHVDSAYGASVALSKSHRSLLSGLERADSLTWDAHKWLFQTFGCAMVLVRDKAHLAQSYSTKAVYIREIENGDDDEPNLFNYGIELTRPARHMKLWFSLRVLGTEMFGRMIEHGFMLAKTAEAELRKLPNWEVTSPATLSIVTFRYYLQGMTDDEANNINETISRNATSGNVAMIRTTHVHGNVSMRMCSLSPEMRRDDMEEIVKQLHAIAQDLALAGKVNDEKEPTGR